jgi:amidase
MVRAGGSIRIPAAQNGIYGMRPTTYQLPLRGMMGLSGWTGVVPATGPMCRSLRDVELFTNLVLSAEPHLHDDTLYKMPWDGKAGSVPSGRKLKIGIMDHDDLVQVQPPMQRAMKLVREKLSALPNVEVVDLKAYKHDLGWDLTVRSAFRAARGAESFATARAVLPGWRPILQTLPPGRAADAAERVHNRGNC